MSSPNPLIPKKRFRWSAMGIILLCTGLGLFERTELITLDLRYGLADTKPRADLLLVVIDKDSIKQYDHWPWPRRYYAEVITTLKQGGAKIIGLDLDFSTPSAASEDEAFVEAVAAAGNVVLSAFHEDKIVGENIIVNSASLPFPELLSVAAGMGSILFPVDPDGTIRRANWTDTLQGETYLSLAAEVARQALHLPVDKTGPGAQGEIRFGDQALKTQSDGTFYINFIVPPQAFPTISFADILEQRVHPEIFKDKIVLIGATALELRDIWSSPFGLTPGLEIQANTLQTLLSGEDYARLPLWTTMLVLLGGAFLLEASLIASLKREDAKGANAFMQFSIVAVSVAAIYGLGALALFKYKRMILDLVPVLSAFLAYYLCTSFSINRLTSRSIQIKTLRLSTLHSLGALSLKEQPLEQSLNFIFEMLKGMLVIQSMVLEIYHPKHRAFVRRIIKTEDRRDNEDRTPTTACQRWIAKAYDTQESVIVSNLNCIFTTDTPTKTKICASLFVPLITHGKRLGVLHLHSLKKDPFDEESVRLLYTVTNQLAMNIENLDLIKEVSQLLNSSIEAFSSALELRDNETEGHSQRVASYATEVGKILGLEKQGLEELRQGALLHDIGKIGVPDAILRKPGKLDAAEMDIIKKHPEYGYRMLKNVNFPEAVAMILLHHHEKFNGSGYPGGLSGDDIVIYSRIFTVVDTFDAITSNRPYRKGAPYEKALDEILRFSGSQFDPKVIEAFLKITKDQLEEIRYKVDETARKRNFQNIYMPSSEHHREQIPHAH